MPAGIGGMAPLSHDLFRPLGEGNWNRVNFAAENHPFFFVVFCCKGLPQTFAWFRVVTSAWTRSCQLKAYSFPFGHKDHPMKLLRLFLVMKHQQLSAIFVLLWTWSWSVWWLTTALNFPSTKTHLQRFFILYCLFITGSLCKKSLAFRTLAEVNRGDMSCSGSRLGWLRVLKLPARFRCIATARVLEDHWKTQKAPCMSYWPYTHPKKSPKHVRKYRIHGASGKAFDFSPLHEEKQSILPAWVRFCPLVLLKVEIFGWNLVPVFERDFARANDVN